MLETKNKRSINKDEFYTIIKDMVQNETVQEMKKYRQHFDTNCFDHCYRVSYCSYCVCKKLGLDYKSSARAAMVHDMFLYDWRQKNGRKGMHAFTHGKTACKNAEKIFDLSEKEKDMIRNHMWPVTIKFPKSIEGFILTFVDKYCAIVESYNCLIDRVNRKLIPRYAYIILSVIILNLNELI